jgi:hypothetical protein
MVISMILLYALLIPLSMPMLSLLTVGGFGGAALPAPRLYYVLFSAAGFGDDYIMLKENALMYS